MSETGVFFRSLGAGIVGYFAIFALVVLSFGGGADCWAWIPALAGFASAFLKTGFYLTRDRWPNA